MAGESARRRNRAVSGELAGDTPPRFQWEFGCAACSREYLFVQGTHTFELRNAKHRANVDRICVDKGTSDAQPATGPGPPSSSSSTQSGGQPRTKSVTLGSNARAISIAAEADLAVPLQLVLIDPSGSVLQTVNGTGGLAVLDRPVSQAGVYVVKVTALSLGPVRVWTAATPTVAR